MEKDNESVRIDLAEEQRQEQAKDQEPKMQKKELEVSELEPRIQPGVFF